MKSGDLARDRLDTILNYWGENEFESI